MLAALAFAVPAAHASTQTLYLDSHDMADDGTSGPVSTPNVLRDGAFYLVEVKGTYSIWAAPVWLADPGCGQPGSAPYYASPGVDNGQTGLDAETVFAGPGASFACANGAQVPRHIDAFKVDTGTGPQHIEPLFGPFDRPAMFHTYFYLLRGHGDNAAFAFSLRDQPTHDNYGQLKIVVRGTDRDDCKSGGWKEFGVFKNQGDCVSYQATDGRNKPAWDH
jgi:hypothetical protein